MVFRLKQGTPDKRAWALRTAILESVEATEVNFGNGAPKCQVQPSPEKRPHLDAMGQMLRVLKKYGVPHARVKPEWGPPESRIMSKPTGGRPLVMATWTPRTGWQIFEEELKKVVGREDVTAEELLRDVREFSS